MADNSIREAGSLSRYMCVSDYQCPMWRANKNYPNNRGGCVDGACEFPIGLQPKVQLILIEIQKQFVIQERQVKESCSNQLTDPKLESPDYAFEGDFNDRLIYYKHLKNKGLRVQNLISK